MLEEAGEVGKGQITDSKQAPRAILSILVSLPRAKRHVIHMFQTEGSNIIKAEFLKDYCLPCREQNAEGLRVDETYVMTGNEDNLHYDSGSGYGREGWVWNQEGKSEVLGTGLDIRIRDRRVSKTA